MTIQHTPIMGLPYPQSTDSADVPRDIQALAQKLDSAGANGVFIIGEVRFIAVANAPTGWLPCDGAARSRTTYAALFAAIAVVFGGGDGSTTFNVPDLRGRVPVGAGQGSGLSNRAVGTRWGVEAIVLSVAQMPSHAHGGVSAGAYTPDHAHLSYNGHFLTTNYGVGLAGDGGAQPYWAPTGDPAPQTGTVINGAAAMWHQHSINGEGGSQGHDNTQPSIAIPAYIYAGV